jgi:hypothetical protein
MMQPAQTPRLRQSTGKSTRQLPSLTGDSQANLPQLTVDPSSNMKLTPLTIDSGAARNTASPQNSHSQAANNLQSAVPNSDNGRSVDKAINNATKPTTYLLH